MQSGAKEGIQVTHFISQQHAHVVAVRPHFRHQRQRGPTYLGTGLHVLGRMCTSRRYKKIRIHVATSQIRSYCLLKENKPTYCILLIAWIRHNAAL
jgi:hypothetical protein